MRVVDETPSRSLTFKDISPGDLFRTVNRYDSTYYYIKCDVGSVPSAVTFNSVNVENGSMALFYDSSPVIIYEAQITAHVVG